MSDTTKFVLPESEIPKAWYNIQADLPFDAARRCSTPGTKQPVGPADLAPLFPMALIQQEVTRERWVEIPEPVREVYRLWRPTPLYPRAPPREGAPDAGAASTTSTRA